MSCQYTNRGKIVTLFTSRCLPLAEQIVLEGAKNRAEFRFVHNFWGKKSSWKKNLKLFLVFWRIFWEIVVSSGDYRGRIYGEI